MYTYLNIMRKSKTNKNVLITGGAGFIGSNLLLHMVPKYSDYNFINIDCLTYAANLSNLKAIENCENYRFKKVDIRDMAGLRTVFEEFEVDSLIHLAAESHVDRSIEGPGDFITTNILGTFNLLEIAKEKHLDGKPFRFHHVSTDEVYGSLGDEGFFTEATSYKPNSPYSASKASSDHLVRAYHKTYGLDVVTTNCSNNYGPYQFPEKLLPLMIKNCQDRKPLPVYGDGENVRDWLYVEDHCTALDLVFHNGETGQTYNIGGHNEISNIKLIKLICAVMDEKLGGAKHEELITFVKDRPGHDKRYAIDASFIEKELGWTPKHNFTNGLRMTIEWYLDNNEWLDNCCSGNYLKYYEDMYANR